MLRLFLVIAVCWLAWMPTAWAGPTSGIITSPVTDDGKFIDAGSKELIERALRDHQARTETQIAFLIVSTLRGERIESFARQTATRWGGGTKVTNRGVLVVLAIEDRQSRIEVGTGLEAKLSDATCKALLDSVRPELRAKDYGGAVAKLANDLITWTGGEATIHLPKVVAAPSAQAPVEERESRRRVDEDATPTSDWVFIGAIAGGVGLLGLIGFLMSGNKNTGGMTFAAPYRRPLHESTSTTSFGSSHSSFGSSHSSFGSSSFGSSSSSSSSSSSYSGGGGSFGGGGASSSW